MNRFSWTTIVLLALTIALLAACSAEIRPVNVDSVTIELRDGVYAAVVEGEYPDACGRIGPIVQTVDGSTIKVRHPENFPKRFERFSDGFFHPLLHKDYSLSYAEQGISYLFPDTGIQFLTLNSA